MEEGKRDVDEASLRASVRDGAAYGFMSGIGESYISAAAVALGASKPFMGVLGAVPHLAGAIAQLASANVADRTLRRRATYMAGAVVQTFSWVPMLGSILAPHPWNLVLLLVGVALYYGGVHYSLPPWNSTMGELVPPERRGRYFGGRNALNLRAMLYGTLLGGVLLWRYAEDSGGHRTFLVLFALALAARALSTGFLAKMRDPPYVLQPEDRFTFIEFARQFPRSNFVRFVLYVAAVNFSVQIAGPFFAVYVLRDLEYGYLVLMGSTLIMLLAQSLTMKTWGRLADRIGNRAVLWVTGIGVAIVPIPWAFGRHLEWIFVAQVLSGLVWSGFNLSTANYIFDAVSPAKRARCVGYFNVVNCAGIFAGGLVGAALVGFVPSRVALGPLSVRFVSELPLLFLLSGLLRLITTLLFLPWIREVRTIRPWTVVDLIARSDKIRAAGETAVAYLSHAWRGPSEPEGPPESKKD